MKWPAKKRPSEFKTLTQVQCSVLSVNIVYPTQSVCILCHALGALVHVIQTRRNMEGTVVIRPNHILAASLTLLQAVTELVPELIWAPEFFGPQEIWSPRNLGPRNLGPAPFWSLRNLVPKKFGPREIWSPEIWALHLFGP